AVMGIHVRQGRGFTDGDIDGSERVAVVSRSVAERFWPAGAVGQRISYDERKATDWITIVGVVDDIAQQGVAKPRAAAVYLPLAQVKQRFWLDHLTFAARAAGAGDPSSVAAAMRAAVHAVDPDQAIE